MRITRDIAITYLVPAVVIIITAVFASTRILIIAAVSAIVLQIGFIFQRIDSDLSTTVDILKNQATVEPIREPNFYNRFQIDVRNSERRVFITYFKNESPYQSNDQKTIEYYEKLSEIIDKKS